MKTLLARTALIIGGLALAAPYAAAQESDSLPPGVTETMISDGAAIFAGAGTCFVCHGQDAKGVPNLGADLTDDEWTHADGTYESILETILAGAQGETGAVMPPKGSPNISEAQVKSVAAYVWSLSHRPPK